MGGGQLGSGRGHRLCGSISPLLISRCTGPIDLMGDRTRAGSFMSMGNHGPAFSKGSAGKVSGGEGEVWDQGITFQLSELFNEMDTLHSHPLSPSQSVLCSVQRDASGENPFLALFSCHYFHIKSANKVPQNPWLLARQSGKWSPAKVWCGLMETYRKC